MPAPTFLPTVPSTTTLPPVMYSQQWSPVPYAPQHKKTLSAGQVRRGVGQVSRGNREPSNRPTTNELFAEAIGAARSRPAKPAVQHVSAAARNRLVAVRGAAPRRAQQNLRRQRSRVKTAHTHSPQ